jgi:predicted metal-dependent peptidase
MRRSADKSSWAHALDAAGLSLPSVFWAGVRTIVIGVDTSGSIGTHELEQFAGEISAIAEEAQPESIHVVYCDAAVQFCQHFGPSEPIQLEPKGGGGTDFRPVFNWVEQNEVMHAWSTSLTCAATRTRHPRIIQCYG